MTSTASNDSQKAPRKLITFDDVSFVFYDVEALDNAFTVAVYAPQSEYTIVFYQLSDSPVTPEGLSLKDLHRRDPGWLDAAKQSIVKKNRDYGIREDRVMLLDLDDFDNVKKLAMILGVSNSPDVSNPAIQGSIPNVFRPVCDTDPEYDPAIHFFCAGYNSKNYDLTMLALYFMEAFAGFSDGLDYSPVDPTIMRRYNNQLFSPEFIDAMPKFLWARDRGNGNNRNFNSTEKRIYDNFLKSGRHLDVARLNEKNSRVGLKYLAGSAGYKILESEATSTKSTIFNLNSASSDDDLCDVIAYNVSDVLATKRLLDDPVYKSGLTTRLALLQRYPELIYRKKPNEYQPDISQTKVQNRRLTVDSTVANFVEKTLSPYGKIRDYEFVDFTYPHPDVAKKLGIEPFDVLEFCRDFFYENVTDESKRKMFDNIYTYFDFFRGKNFNPTDFYQEVFGPDAKVWDRRDAPKVPTILPLFNHDRQPSSCYGKFQLGGIHGAEFNSELFNGHVEAIMKYNNIIDEVKQKEPDPNQLRLCGELDLSDDRKVSWKQILKSGYNTVKAAEAGKCQYIAQKTLPSIFVWKKKNGVAGEYKLNDKYAFTSAGLVIHQDFSSYYPNLFCNLKIYENEELGEDRYYGFYQEKQAFGAKVKDKSLPDEDREVYSIMYAITKLLLNSASGKSDGDDNNAIQVNNATISMRIIGQLFTWFVTQVQMFEIPDVRVVSINTDGAYLTGDSQKISDVLERVSKIINVPIEPELQILISKDTNNRVAFSLPQDGDNPWDVQISELAGRDISCAEGPNPKQKLTHPAVIDRFLAFYLRDTVTQRIPQHRSEPVSLTDLCDDVVIRGYMDDLISSALNGSIDDKIFTLKLMQNMISSSKSSYKYVFVCDLVEPEETMVIDPYTKTIDKLSSDDPHFLINPQGTQYYNRVFYVKPDTPGAKTIHQAEAKLITDSSAGKRLSSDEPARRYNAVAETVLNSNGVYRTMEEVSRHPGSSLIPANRDITITKISLVEPWWPIIIVNDDLRFLGEDKLNNIISSLDLDIYVALVCHFFNQNWRNITPKDDKSFKATTNKYNRIIGAI